MGVAIHESDVVRVGVFDWDDVVCFDVCRFKNDGACVWRGGCFDSDGCIAAQFFPETLKLIYCLVDVHRSPPWVRALGILWIAVGDVLVRNLDRHEQPVCSPSANHSASKWIPL